MYKKRSENFVHEANYNYLSDVNFLFISFSLNDAIDFFINTKDNSDIESYSDEHAHDLAMMPAIEKENSERQSHLWCVQSYVFWWLGFAYEKSGQPLCSATW